MSTTSIACGTTRTRRARRFITERYSRPPPYPPCHPPLMLQSSTHPCHARTSPDSLRPRSGFWCVQGDPTLSQRLHSLTGLILAGQLCVGTAASAQGASDALKFIGNPGGGQVVYGTIDGSHTP